MTTITVDPSTNVLRVEDLESGVFTVTNTCTNASGSAEDTFTVTVTGPSGGATVVLTPASGPAGTHFFAAIDYDGTPGTGDEACQWYDGADPIPGATWPSYVPGDDLVSTNRLRCEITGTGGNVMSAYVNVVGKQAATTTATPATRAAVWAAAQPGDIIEFEAGEYPDWVPAAKANAGAPIILRSAEPGNRAQFRGVRMNNVCEGVIFENLHMDFLPTDATLATQSINIINGACLRITFKNCEFNGGLGINSGQPSYLGLGVGRMVTVQAGATNVAVIDNDFHTCRNGVMAFTDESNFLTIRGNVSWLHSGDTFQLAAVYGLNFTGNIIRDFKRETSDHPDALQFQSAGGTRGMVRCYIGGNIIHSGAAEYDWTQSLFLSAEDFDNRHADWIVENNFIYNAHTHGITIINVSGAIVRQNTIVRNYAQASEVPGTEFPHIQVGGTCTGVVIEKNVVDQINVTAGAEVTLVDNYLLVYAAEGAQSEFVGGLAANSSMANLQPVPGGTILTGGYGATYTDQDLPGNVGPPIPGEDPIVVTPYRFDRFVFTGTDMVSATAKVRGSGTPNAGVQFRGESAGGNTAWFSGTVGSDGNFEITGSVPFAQWGEWYTAAVRYTDDDEFKESSSNTFGCGKMFVLMAQSEAEYVNNYLSTYNGASNPAPASVLSENGVLVGYSQAYAAKIRPLPFDTVTYQNNVTIGKPMMWMFNMMSVFPGKVCFVDGSVPGTGFTDLFSDDDANDDTTNNRSWQWLEDTVNTATDDGWTEANFLMDCAWYTNPTGLINQYGFELFAPGFTGQNWDGSAFTLGSNDASGASVDHCLWDFAASSGAKGRGLFSDKTKLCAMPSNNYVDYLQNLKNSLTFADGSSNGRIGYETSTQSKKDFFLDAKTDRIRGVWGASPHVYRTGTFTSSWGDAIHPDVNSPYGNRLLGMHFAAACLKALDLGDVDIPTITGFTMGPANAYMDVEVGLTTGTLTTSRIAGSYGAPSSPPSYYNEVMGFEILRDGAALTDMTPSGFTAVIQDAAAGIVRITPTVAFAQGDTVFYARGGKSMVLDYQADAAAAMCLDFLVESTSIPGYDGVPVEPQIAGLVVSGGGSSYVPAFYTPEAQAAAMRVIYHTAFTGVEKTGVKKATYINTYSPGASDGDGANATIVYGANAADLFLVSNGNTNFRMVLPQNTFASVNMSSTFGASWRDNDYAYAVAFDTTQAAFAERCKVLMICVDTGVSVVAPAVAEGLYPTLNSDLPILSAGLMTSWFSRSTLGTQPLITGSLERVQAWVNVAMDVTDFSGLFDGTKLVDPALADGIAAKGGGTLAAGQRYLDIYGADGFASSINKGLGDGTPGAPIMGPNPQSSGAALVVRT